jgi:hypothetical protein
MMRFVVSLAVLAVVFARWQSLAADSATTPQAAPVVVPVAPQSDSKQTGSATLTATADNKTQVVVSVTGEPAGAQEPAHIHQGSCKNLNPKPVFPLNPIVDGKSTTIVDAPLLTLQSGQFAINAHQSTTNIGVYVACGDIPPAAGAAAPSMPNTAPPTMSPRSSSRH